MCSAYPPQQGAHVKRFVSMKPEQDYTQVIDEGGNSLKAIIKTWLSWGLTAATIVDDPQGCCSGNFLYRMVRGK